jgi:mono/diheme cytochrome c family protein
MKVVLQVRGWVGIGSDRRPLPRFFRRLPGRLLVGGMLLVGGFRAAAVAETVAAIAETAPAVTPGPVGGDAAAGRRWLRTKAYLPADFDQETFDALWTTWEEPLRSQAATATPDQRRRMAFDRYGLVADPDDPTRPLQYVVDSRGGWTMSCLACHQGQVQGVPIPGAPNADYALETLTEEVRLVKVQQRKAFGHMDFGSLLLPLGTTVGTTNAVVFGVALMRHRDADLNIVARPPRFDLMHHDMDAPAWWHYRRRRTLYADGFAPRGHRMLMQFLLVKENGPERFREWEDEFRDIEAWILSLAPPRWPGEIDQPLAARGAEIFARHCAECHGTRGSYPDRVVAIDEVGTDRVRLASLTAEQRRDLNASWFGHHGRAAIELSDRTAPIGYVAPPLDGVWASAPYFHNGSVPTLWHVLHPTARPVVWRRVAAGYDASRVGLTVEELDELPNEKLPPAERRRIFDTRRPGKAADGHDFPDLLDEKEKTAVLEYLKTL